MTIVAGTLMRYKSLDIQNNRYYAKALCPEAFEPEMSAERFADTGCFLL